MKIPIVFVVLILSTSVLCNKADNLPVRNCSLFVRCSFEEDIVWATDDTMCFPFINACHLGTENCNRRANNTPELRVIKKKICQAMCPTMCLQEYKPVCGMYNGEKRQFSSRCEMDSEICLTAKFYQLYKEGPCE